MKRQLLVCIIAVASLGLLVPSPAQAVPIGTFSWASDCGPSLGQCFTVENFSAEFFALPSLGLAGQAFGDVVIHLTTDFDPLSIDSGLIPLASIAQTTADLTGVSIVLATLTFGLELQGIITLQDGETGATIAGLMAPDTIATIDFAPSSEDVPEPATLLLVTTGLAAMAIRRRRTRNG